MNLDARKLLSLLLVPVYLALIAMFLLLDIGITFNPPILLLLFNTLFLGLIPLYVAYTAYKSFRDSGSTGVLLEGTGMLILGLGAISAGIVNYLPDPMNANVTVHNTSFCIGAFFQFVGILIALSGTVPGKRPGDATKIATLYGGCVLVFSSFVIAAVLGAVPPFFIPGVGFTVLRELIITGAILFFALASGILLWLYSRKQEEFFFWYSIGLALVGIGLLAVHFPSVLGSPLGWVGRSAQYLGAFYVLFAFVALNRSAQKTGIKIGEMLARFFGEAETSYKALVETATDAIVVFDEDDRIIVWNGAAEKMFGYSLSDAVGWSFFDLAIQDDFKALIKNNVRAPASARTDSDANKPVEVVARRKDRSTFPAELALSRHMLAGTWVHTCIIRDLTERKKAEEAILRLSTFPERNPNPILEIDERGHIQYLNPSAARLFPTLKDGAQNHPFIGDLPDFTDTLTQGTTDVMNREIQAGGRWYQQSVNYLRDIRRVRIYGIDITGRKQAEESLKESEERFRTIAEISPVQLSIGTRKEGEILFTNQAYDTAFGFAPGELVGHRTPDLYFDPLDRSVILGTLREKGFVENFEVRVRRKDGTMFWVNVSLRTIRFSGEDAILAASIDITGRKLAEEELTTKNDALNTLNEELTSTEEELHQTIDELTRAEKTLRESEEKYRTIVEIANEGIWAVDADLKTTFVNSRMVQMLGYSREEMSGRSALDFMDEECRSIAEKRLPERRQGKKGSYEHKYIRKDGSVVWTIANVTPLIDPENRFTGSVGMLTDITDRKRNEEDLKQKNIELNKLNEDLTTAQEELEQNVDDMNRNEKVLKQHEEHLSQALAEKEILLAEIHHRVKNNLTAFISLLSLEGTTEETPAGRDLKKDLQNRALSMALIHETLFRTHQFSYVDMQEYLTPLVNQIVKSYSSSECIRTIIETQGVSLDLVRATPAGLIVNELVTNSLKHAFPKVGIACGADPADTCTIGIRLTKMGGSYLLVVSDNGIGMPAGFDPLTAKTLGLKLVTFLAKHQMRATVEVRTGKGTEFIFRFSD